MTTLTPQQLQLDLHLAFPGIGLEQLEDDTPILPGPKVWLRTPVLMPDLWPQVVPESAFEGRTPGIGYRGRVHGAFVAWLADRGWDAVTVYDEQFLLMPLSAFRQSGVSDAERPCESGGDLLATGATGRGTMEGNGHA